MHHLWRAFGVCDVYLGKSPRTCGIWETRSADFLFKVQHCFPPTLDLFIHWEYVPATMVRFPITVWPNYRPAGRMWPAKAFRKNLQIWNLLKSVWGYICLTELFALDKVYLHKMMNQKYFRTVIILDFTINLDGTVLRWTACVYVSVLLNLFHTSDPFIEQDNQNYPQYTQWCSFIENMKLNCYGLEWFTNIYIGCNLWFCKFTPLEW